MSTVAESQNKSKSLVPTKPLTQIEDLRKTWESLEGQVNLVSPLAIVNTIPKLHAISLHWVKIDPTVNQRGQGPEVYYDPRFCDKDERALGAVGLQKIAQAAGAEIVGTLRIDNRSESYYCNMEITVGIRDFDGTWRQTKKSREIDLRDGEPDSQKPERDNSGRKTGQMTSLDPSALADRRRHIQSFAETKAFNRALRALLTLKQKYSLGELSRYFVVPKLIPDLDPSDPVQKDALINLAIGREKNLYNRLVNNTLPSVEMRVLKDVTPEPATSPTSAGAQPPIEPGPVSRETEAYEEEDFEAMEFEPLEPVAVCACPCGDQAELSGEVARITIERCGSPRCKECFPGKTFNYNRHKDFGSLELPKYPGLTADQIIAAVKKAGKS